MMMGAGFGWLLTLNTILLLFGVWGFAYIIWLLASKETGNLKLLGQVISGVIAVLIVVILIVGASYGGRMGKGGIMMEPGMMQMKGDQSKMMMELKKMTPEMQKMMKEKMGTKAPGCK